MTDAVAVTKTIRVPLPPELVVEAARKLPREDGRCPVCGAEHAEPEAADG